MAKHYKKELPRTPFHFSVGRAVPFDSIDDNYGYFATGNGWEISELDAAVAGRRGGVSEISEAEYQEYLEKKSVAPPPSKRQRQRQAIGSKPPPSVQVSLAAARAGTSVIGATRSGTPITGIVKPQKADGLKVDREFVKPVAGKIPSARP